MSQRFSPHVPSPISLGPVPAAAGAELPWPNAEDPGAAAAADAVPAEVFAWLPPHAVNTRHLWAHNRGAAGFWQPHLHDRGLPAAMAHLHVGFMLGTGPTKLIHMALEWAPSAHGDDGSGGDDLSAAAASADGSLPASSAVASKQEGPAPAAAAHGSSDSALQEQRRWGQHTAKGSRTGLDLSAALHGPEAAYVGTRQHKRMPPVVAYAPASGVLHVGVTQREFAEVLQVRRRGLPGRRRHMLHGKSPASACMLSALASPSKGGRGAACRRRVH